MFEGEQFAGAAEPGGDFVENQQYAVPVAQAAGVAQVFGVVEIHAAGTLYDGFQYQGGEAAGVLFKQIFQCKGGIGRPCFVKTAGWLRQEILYRQAAAKQAVHAGFGVAHRHGVPSVAMIAGADGGEAVFTGQAFGLLVLQSHLHGDFYRYRAAVGKEDFIESGGQNGNQTFGQTCGRFMGEAAEHDVAHLLQLGLCGGVEAGVVVAVQGSPPGRHAVDELPAVGQFDDTAVCGANRINRQGIGHGGVGVPNVSAVDGEQLFGCHKGCVVKLFKDIRECLSEKFFQTGIRMIKALPPVSGAPTRRC